MLFVIDVGNTNIVAAFMRSASDIAYTGRTETDKSKNAEEFIREMEFFFDDGKIGKNEVTGAIISSVVPEVTDALAEAAKAVTGLEPLVLTYKTETGITLGNDSPSTTGTDLIAAAAGAAREYSGAVAIFDLGTATTLTVLTADKVFLGGLIMPGVGISLNAMIGRASQLMKFDIAAPEHFIGRHTVEAMQSGVVYGNAAMMDALSERVEDELGEQVTVLVTGGLGGLICPFCKREMIPEPDLVLKGLWYIYKINKESKRTNR